MNLSFYDDFNKNFLNTLDLSRSWLNRISSMRVNIAFLFRATYYQHATQAFPSMKTDVTFHSKADESKNHHPPSFLLPSLGRELLPWRKILAILSLLPRGHAFSLPRSSSVMSSTNVFLSSLAAVEAGSTNPLRFNAMLFIEITAAGKHFFEPLPANAFWKRMEINSWSRSARPLGKSSEFLKRVIFIIYENVSRSFVPKIWQHRMVIG